MRADPALEHHQHTVGNRDHWSDALTTPFTTTDYMLEDHPRTLFPFNATRILVEKFSAELQRYVYDEVVTSTSPDSGFMIQQRCYAAKRGHNLRRTVKLDPVAEYFIYDVVFRNRKAFRSDHRDSRKCFGYRFPGGRPTPAPQAYAEYKAALASARASTTSTLKVDVATYFNALYHHDLVQTTRSLSWSEPDVDALGRFLREINSGRSIDCLPQGIHPCKVLGSEFLRFVDNSLKLKSALIVRFQDDMHFFDQDRDVLLSDLVTLQELLGEKGLSLNDSKTMLGSIHDVDPPHDIDAIKQGLLQARRARLLASDEIYVSSDEANLAPEQVEYLLSQLQSPDIEESDAELVLTLLRDHTSEVVPHLHTLLANYPGVTKSLYHYCKLSEDTSAIAGAVLGFLRDSANATEYQLFWLAKLVEDSFSDTPSFGLLVEALLEHPRATIISRAKVLEMADRRFGLPELRAEHLRSGRSDWLAWASAIGTRAEPAAGRNHTLGYFAKSSRINAFVAACVKAM